MILEIVLLVGILILFYFIYIYNLSINTRNWNPVQCQIEISEMEKSDIGNRISYKAKVKYSYRVDGKIYFSKRIFVGDYNWKNLPSSVKKHLNKYKQGAKVTAYYNPMKPNKSVLETGVNIMIYRELYVSIMFIVLSVLMYHYEDFFVSLFGL